LESALGVLGTTTVVHARGRETVAGGKRRSAFLRRPAPPCLMLPDVEQVAAIGKLWAATNRTWRGAGARGKLSYRVRRDSTR
jgi:hypothetical protein